MQTRLFTVLTTIYLILSASFSNSPSSLIAQAQPIGDEVIVNTYTQGFQASQDVAIDGNGNYVIVWSSLDNIGNHNGIFAQRYSSEGNMIGGEFRVNTTAIDTLLQPMVDMNTQGDFAIVWQSRPNSNSGSGNIYLRRYSADGVAIDTEDVLVNTSILSEYSLPDVAIHDDGALAVVWGGEFASPTSDIYMKLYQPDGTPSTGSEIIVNTYTNEEQTSPRVAFTLSGSAIVVWEGQKTDQNGNQLNREIFMRRFANDGTPIDNSDIPVNTIIEEDQRRPSLAVNDDGTFIVAWEGEREAAPGKDIYYRRFAADAAPLDNDDVMVSMASSGTNITSSVESDGNGNYIITWSGLSGVEAGQFRFDIYMRRYEAAGTALDSAAVMVNTMSDSLWCFFQSIDMTDNGDFIVSWYKDQDGGGFNVFARLYKNTNTSLKPTLSDNSDIKVFPNPASETLTVEGVGEYVQVYTMTGQLVLAHKSQSNMDTATIDVSRLPSGMYLVISRDRIGKVRHARLLVE